MLLFIVSRKCSHFAKIVFDNPNTCDYINSSHIWKTSLIFTTRSCGIYAYSLTHAVVFRSIVLCFFIGLLTYFTRWYHQVGFLNHILLRLVRFWTHLVGKIKKSLHYLKNSIGLADATSLVIQRRSGEHLSREILVVTPPSWKCSTTTSTIEIFVKFL